MQKTQGRKRIRGIFQTLIFVLLSAFCILLEFLDIPYLKDEFQNRILGLLIQQLCGAAAAILLMNYLGIKAFQKPEKLLFLLPYLLVAVNNLPFSTYFNGKMQLIHASVLDFSLFFGYCMAVGLFEECVFRGMIFSALAGYFSNDKRGFLKTYFLSSVLFGLAHLFNGLSLNTLLQVAYTILTGGLFAFCFIKTKNLLCPVLVHGLYNFCGLLFDVQGLGTGVVFDLNTVIITIIIGVLAGIYVLYNVFAYSERECRDLYKRLGVEDKR